MFTTVERENGFLKGSFFCFKILNEKMGSWRGGLCSLLLKENIGSWKGGFLLKC